MSTVLIILIIFAALAAVIWIWGIVAAIRTQDEKIKVWKLLTHLFFWGGPIAAIIYAVRVGKR